MRVNEIGIYGTVHVVELEHALNPIRILARREGSVRPSEKDIATANAIFLSKMLATLVVKEVMTLDEAKQIASAHDIIDDVK